LISILDVSKTIWRCFEHLPKEKSLEYLILKGHLLAEEEMLSYIKRAMSNPTAILEGRFSFYQLVQVVEAMRPAGAEQWLWEALRGLNRLRNEMAHNLQPKDFARKAEEFARIVEGHTGLDVSGTHPDRNEPLRYAIAMVVCYVHDLPRGRKKYPTT